MLAAAAGPNRITLGALTAGWTGTLLVLSGAVQYGILALIVACCLDGLDGAYARRTGQCSPLGTQLDALADVTVYLVSSAVLFATVLSPHPLASAVVGTAIIGAGSFRLARFVTVDGPEGSYHGLTAFHMLAVVVLVYVGSRTVTGWSPWLSTAVVFVTAPLMVSRRRIAATRSRYVLAVIGGGIVGVACLFGVVPALPA